jgi:cytochrome c-type biogenesis protein CcmF
MIFDIGYLILVTALLLSLFGVVAGFWGGRQRNPNLVKSSFHAIYAVAAAVWLAALILWYGLLTDKFQVNYVWNHSEKALPTFYKFSALWGGQAGSLLFWTLILSVYSIIVATAFRRKQLGQMPYVNAVLLSTSAFFLTLLVFAENPFKQSGFLPPDGQGLNPLLQNYWMVIHPVMLYTGYVGLTVPFAFAMGALFSKNLGNQWVRTVRRWTLIPWMFLSAGILMGSQWAYMELGWGGYWAWDPVENASFLPWLTATAFLHCILIQERRGILKVWNIVLIGFTYFLVILGTFTTRSGIIESVHSFARSSVGMYFLVFLIISIATFVWLLFDRLPLLRSENEIDSVSSRETAFLVNNWLFTGLAFSTLWGTFFPMFSEILTGRRISVNAPWFNHVNGPLFLLLLLMMGIGPLLGWRRTSAEVLRKQFIWPVVAALIFAAIFAYFSPRLYPTMGLSVCVLVLATIIQEFVRGVVARRAITGENPLTALFNLMRRNGQRYGGYIVHLAIVMIGIAVIGNTFYQVTTNVNLAANQSVKLAGYTLTFTRLESEHASNRMEFTAHLALLGPKGQALGTISPGRNVYDKTPDQPTSEVGLRMSPSDDIYVVLNGWKEDGSSATFTIFVNPLTIWIWIGGLVLVLGTLICIWPNPARKEERVVAPAGAMAEVSM